MITINLIANGGASMTAPRRIKTPAECKMARAQARGWNDVRKGRGFRDAYDGWDKLRQYSYERGRQRAVLARERLGSGQSLPVWNRRQSFYDMITAALGVPRGCALIEETALVRKRKP